LTACMLSHHDCQRPLARHPQPAIPPPFPRPPLMPPPVAPLASNQLDSSLLDTTLHSLLLEQLTSSFLHPSKLTTFYLTHPAEVDLTLKAAAFLATTARDIPSPGMKMQGLMYSSKVRRRSVLKFLLGFTTILLPYAAEKIASATPPLENDRVSTTVIRRQRILKFLTFLTTLTSLLSTLNLLRFLTAHTHPTLSSRLLDTPYVRDMSPVSTLPPSARPINYSFISRRLLTSSVLSLLPLLSPFGMSSAGNLRNAVGNAFRWGRADRGGSVEGDEGDLVCGICEGKASIPYRTDCGHVFCYLCLRSACERRGGWTCTVCGVVVGSSERVGGTQEGRGED